MRERPPEPQNPILKQQYMEWLHCMCGMPCDDHTMDDGHSPVDMRSYYRSQNMTNAKKIVLYHANCADGFTAAWAVHELGTWGDTTTFIPVKYNEPPPAILPGDDVIIVDFSYPPDVIEAMSAEARTVLILDHHASAEKQLDHLPAPPENYETFLNETAGKPENVRALFDMNRSGAGIAWDFFAQSIQPSLDNERPMFLNYVEDRDLWRFKLPHSKEFNEYIFSFSYTFDNWSRLDTVIFGDAVREGAAILRKKMKDIDELIAAGGVRRVTIGNINVPVLNVPYTMGSDAAAVLLERFPEDVFAAYTWQDAEYRHWGLRSRKGDDRDGSDVSRIASRFGGGGHTTAAAFRTKINQIGTLELHDLPIGSAPYTVHFLTDGQQVSANASAEIQALLRSYPFDADVKVHTTLHALCEGVLSSEFDEGKGMANYLAEACQSAADNCASDIRGAEQE